MSTLKEILLDADATRQRVIADAVALVESEVRSKGGMSGMVIKTGFAAVKALKPTLIRDSVDHLLDAFVEKMEPFYADWVARGKAPGLEAFLVGQSSRVANALLGVTDERARRVEAGVVKSTYERLRPMGEKNVEAALPALARTLEKYVA